MNREYAKLVATFCIVAVGVSAVLINSLYEDSQNSSISESALATRSPPIEEQTNTYPALSSPNDRVDQSYTGIAQAEHAINEFPDPKSELRKLGFPSSGGALLDTLKDTNASSEARYWSALALGESGFQDAGSTLATIAHTDADVEVRMGAIGGLALLDGPESLDVLDGLLMHDADTTVRLAVVSALYRANSEDGRQLIRESALTQSQVPAVRLQAAEAIAENLSAESDANLMRVLLVDEHPMLRARAAISLSVDYHEEALPTLVHSALDSELPPEIWDEVRNRLRAITGEDFEHAGLVDYASNPAAREAIATRISVWWNTVSGGG